MSIKNLIVGASIASTALAHLSHKRGAIPVDGTIWTSCVEAGVVALTFDDGPYIYTQEIVDQLTAAGHRATFFQNGQNWDTIYNYNSTLLSMIAGGHQVASHTWSHADLATLDAAGITDQMGELEAAHLAILGKAPTYMRPPYLSTNDLAISTLQSLGYKIIEVDIDTQDWAEGPIGQIDLSIAWYEGNYTAGGTISLNHDPYQPTAETFVPAIISYLASQGKKCKFNICDQH
ncbi:putative esterase [Microthyrium microscopicum]|uniref:Putative esterase n=1 Tax=Microthyrium microscopicum TaxID=703497 RepID=A0A6A6UN20_9PEZI|nr:putative esterase [Microthyrium microscopicum]